MMNHNAINRELAELYAQWREETGDAVAAAILTAAQVQVSEAPAHVPEAPLKPGDVAKLLRVSVHTVLDWIRTAQLKASNIATGARPRYVIQRADVDRFLASRQPDPPMQRGRRRAA